MKTNTETTPRNPNLTYCHSCGIKVTQYNYGGMEQDEMTFKKTYYCLSC